jgi:phosphoenolpyruvate carboxykinase (ATP)
MTRIRCTDLLNSFQAWKDKAEFDATERKLVRMFQENFRAFEGNVNSDVKAAASDVHIAAEQRTNVAERC